MNKKNVFSENYAPIARALHNCIEILTACREETIGDLMSNGLRPLAHAAGLDRVVIYRLSNDGGKLEQAYVWAYGRTAGLDDEPVRAGDNQPAANWLKRLKLDQCINCNVLDMAEDEAAFLRRFGVNSIFCVPIFIHGRFWGAVTLEDHTRFRYFAEDCLYTLRAAARLCANTFIQAQTERQLKESNKYYNLSGIKKMEAGRLPYAWTAPASSRRDGFTGY